uniref:Putative methyltransferase n=1 Tax=viral metagenome TaxID=1070528 RepID=A0A6M3MEZ6_9ZZZZ
MKRFLTQFHYGQKGFTLIELLVVVAILGALAAIVVPNVSKFMGTGTVQSANTEAHNVQTAVIAYIVDNNVTTCTGTVGPAADIPTAPPTPPDTSVKSFLTGALQATYTITDGEIASAIAESDGKWKDLTYTLGSGWAPTTAPES